MMKLLNITGLRKNIHLSELISGSAVALIVKVIGLAAAFIFSVLITRNYGAAAFGVFSLCFATLQILSVVGGLGFDTALLRFVSEYASNQQWTSVQKIYRSSTQLTLAVSLALALLLYLLSSSIANKLFSKGHLSSSFQIISLAVLPMVFLSINAQCLRGLKKIWEFSFYQFTVYFILSSLVLLLFIGAEYMKAEAPIIAFVSAIVISSALSFLSWKKNIKRAAYAEQSMNPEHNPITLKALFEISFPMLLASSAFYVLQWTDILILGYMTNDADVGIYTVATRIATITTIPLYAINSIAAPKFAECHGKNDLTGLEETALQSSKMIFIISLPIFIIIFCFPSFLLNMFGHEFISGSTSLLILAIGQFINAISGSVGVILQMTGKQKIFQNILFVTIAINITTNLLLIPFFGIKGAAIANCISMVFWNLFSVYNIKKYYNFLTIYIPFMVKARF